MTDKEAMAMALEALEDTHYRIISAGLLDQDLLNRNFTVATALRERLAQPEQEPVAHDPLPRACNLAGVDYQTFLKIKAYMPVQEIVPEGVITAIRNEGLTLVKNLQGYRLMRLGKVEAQATPPQRTEQEPVGRFTGKFTVDAHDRMLCEVVCSNAIPTAGAALYDAPLPFRPQNFCSRCGKRTPDLTHIHTCTPPKENT